MIIIYPSILFVASTTHSTANNAHLCMCSNVAADNLLSGLQDLLGDAVVRYDYNNDDDDCDDFFYHHVIDRPIITIMNRIGRPANIRSSNFYLSLQSAHHSLIPLLITHIYLNRSSLWINTLDARLQSDERWLNSRMELDMAIDQ